MYIYIASLYTTYYITNGEYESNDSFRKSNISIPVWMIYIVIKITL